MMCSIVNRMGLVIVKGPLNMSKCKIEFSNVMNEFFIIVLRL